MNGTKHADIDGKETPMTKSKVKSKPATFARRIAKHREAEGLSYREAEDASGVDKASIHRIEMGKMPNLPNFARLCKWAQLDANQAIEEFSGS